MKHYLIILLMLTIANAYGQQVKYDASLKRTPLSSAENDRKTKLVLMESLLLWNYTIDTTYRGREADAVKPIGRLTFYRSKPMADSLSQLLPDHSWTPTFSFNIFSIADTNHCYKQSKLICRLSSCVAPNVGGDMFVVDNYVFLNEEVCLDCENPNTKTDYCRPVINYVFANLDPTKITTIESLTRQLGIAKRELKK